MISVLLNVGLQEVRLHGDFCCNFSRDFQLQIAGVNQLRFQCDSFVISE